MKITVLGSGAGGTAVAYDFSAHGHEVSIFDFKDFPDNIKAIKQQKGIFAEGKLSGFAPIRYAGHNIEKALKGAEIIFAVGPAFSTKPIAEVCRPLIHKEQIFIICPGSTGGAMEFKKSCKIEITDETPIVAETSTLPYAVRLPKPGKINVFLKLKDGCYLATLPAKNTKLVLSKIKKVYPAMVAAKNVLQTSLQNGNPVIHPAVTLLNASTIDKGSKKFLFYEDGVTDAVGRLIEAVDRERILLGDILNVHILADPEIGFTQGYMKKSNYSKGYSRAPGFKGIKAQTSLDHRYLHEDVGYGLVFLSLLAKQFGVKTPAMDAVIQIASIVTKRNYLEEAKRTPESLGLSGYSIDQIIDLCS